MYKLIKQKYKKFNNQVNNTFNKESDKLKKRYESKQKNIQHEYNGNVIKW